MPHVVQKQLFGQVFIKNPVYMDIYSDDYASLFIDPCKTGSSLKWYDKTTLIGYCRLERVFPIPYKDYYYDKPVLAASLWLLYTSTPAMLQLELGFRILFFYIAFSLTVAISLVIHTIYLFKLCDFLQTPFIYRVVASFTSTLIVYGIYSWDAIAVVFLTLFIYYYVEGRGLRALFMLSMFTLLNLYGLVLISLILYQYCVFRDREDYKSLIGLVPVALLTALLAVLSPRSLIDQLMWFEKTICNSCIFLIVTRDPGDVLNMVLSFTVWTSVFLALIPFKPKGLLGREGFSYIAVLVALTNIFLPKLTPQQLLYILPYIPMLYTDMKKIKTLVMHYAIDLLNSMIIILWFKDAILRRELSFLGISQTFNPHRIDSPIQWIAQTRNIILLIHTVLIARNNLKPQVIKI